MPRGDGLDLLDVLRSDGPPSSGEGLEPPLQPHHRASAAHPENPPWPGLLVGGGLTPFDWKDRWDSAETNEVSLVWSAAFAYNLAMFLR